MASDASLQFPLRESWGVDCRDGGTEVAQPARERPPGWGSVCTGPPGAPDCGLVLKILHISQSHFTFHSSVRYAVLNSMTDIDPGPSPGNGGHAETSFSGLTRNVAWRSPPDEARAPKAYRTVLRQSHQDRITLFIKRTQDRHLSCSSFAFIELPPTPCGFQCHVLDRPMVEASQS